VEKKDTGDRSGDQRVKGREPGPDGPGEEDGLKKDKTIFGASHDRRGGGGLETMTPPLVRNYEPSWKRKKGKMGGTVHGGSPWLLVMV